MSGQTVQPNPMQAIGIVPVAGLYTLEPHTMSPRMKPFLEAEAKRRALDDIRLALVIGLAAVCEIERLREAMPTALGQPSAEGNAPWPAALVRPSDVATFSAALQSVELMTRGEL